MPIARVITAAREVLHALRAEALSRPEPERWLTRRMEQAEAGLEEAIVEFDAERTAAQMGRAAPVPAAPTDVGPDPSELASAVKSAVWHLEMYGDIGAGFVRDLLTTALASFGATQRGQENASTEDQREVGRVDDRL